MSFIKRNFRLLLCALAVLLLVTGISAYFGRTAIPTGSWGLSFQKEGQAPIGNATESALRQYDAVYKADGTEKVLYITFDAGYENGNTSKILDVLKQHSVPATFFVVGPYLEQNPELVKRMVSEGHIVGNHTYHHYDMSKISDPDTFEMCIRDSSCHRRSRSARLGQTACQIANRKHIASGRLYASGRDNLLKLTDSRPRRRHRSVASKKLG